MLCRLGNEERYKDRRKDPNDMELDAAEGEDDKAIRYTAAEWEEWNSSADDTLLARMQAQKDELEQQMDYLGKGGGKGGKSGGGNGKPTPGGKGGEGGARIAYGSRDAKGELICAWCGISGHIKKECKKLAKHKTDMDAERAKKGQAPFVPRGAAGSKTGLGSLEREQDWDVEVLGLTGDRDIAALTAEEMEDRLKIEDFADYDIEPDSEDESDYVEEIAERSIDVSEEAFTPVPMRRRGRFGSAYRASTCASACCTESSDSFSSSDKNVPIDRNTPMAELFARAARMQAPKIPISADEPKIQ